MTTTEASGVRSDPDRDDRMQPWVYELVRALLVPILRTVFRLRSLGEEHVPATGPVLLAATHRSNFDPFVVGAPLTQRRLRFMAKAELYKVPGLRWLLRNGGCFKVERGKGDTAAIVAAERLLRAGELVVVFPEGTRNRDGKARPRTGAARLALRTGAPLVPAAHTGTDGLRLFPPRLPRFAVAFGPPIDLSDLATLEPREAARVATARWSAAVAELHARLGR
jgi:1-acyl-sn-glycerol-3-phosphate acyltransferase